MLREGVDSDPNFASVLSFGSSSDITSRKHTRFATGRKTDLRALIETLPELLVECVRTAIAENLGNPGTVNGSNSAARHRRVSFEGTLPPNLASEGSTLSIDLEGPSDDADILAAKEETREDPPVSDPYNFCSLQSIVRAHGSCVIDRIASVHRLSEEMARGRSTPTPLRLGFHYGSRRRCHPAMSKNCSTLFLCPRECFSPFNFRLWGILPWSEEARQQCFSFSWCYSWLFVVMAGFAFVTSTLIFFFCYEDESREDLFGVTNVFVAFGALLVALQGRILAKRNILGSSSALLCAYAVKRQFHYEWRARTRFQGALTTLVQTVVALAAMTPCFLERNPAPNYFELYQTCFVLSCGVILTWSSFVWHICSGLQLAVEAFGALFSADPDFNKAINDWADTRVVTRELSAAISPIVCTLTFFAFGGIMVCVITLMVMADNGNILEVSLWQPVRTHVPALAMAVSLAITLVKAASVTETCKVVPEMVNSWSLGVDFDEERSYLADYMERSNTGFYLLGVRLTLSIVLRIFNSAVLVGATVLVRVFAQVSQLGSS